MERATRELADMASRLLRIRAGELAEPPHWSLPGRRQNVGRIAEQLAPIRSRDALVSSYLREACRDEAVRLGYGLAWLAIARSAAAATTRRRHLRSAARTLRGRG